MNNVVSIQISLDAREYQLLETRAAALGTSVSEVARRSVLDGLQALEAAPGMPCPGFAETGDSPFSGSIHDWVYGSRH